MDFICDGVTLFWKHKKKETVFLPNYYAISTAKRVNMIKLSVVLFFVLIISLMLSSPAVALMYVEDFEYDKPDQNDFTNGVFNHNIMPMPPLNSPFWDISDFGSPPSGNALDLWPAADEVTFNLSLGEYVDYVSIDFIDWLGDTTFEVFGTLDTYSVSILPGGWTSADTSGQNLGQITMVKLSSYEGAFDNLTINVVPEPATFLLFGLGAAFLRKKR